MKKNNLTWFFLSLMLAVLTVGVTACSDDEEGTTTPVFPETKTITANAGESTTLSFNANMAWNLSSSALWCQFVADNDITVSNLTGQPGEQNINIKITDESQTFESSSATITLTMGGQSEVIATITRAAKEKAVKLLDANGNELSKVEIGTSGDITITVEANFTYALDVAEKITSTKATDSENQYIIQVKEEYLKNPIAESEGLKLNIIDESATIASYPVSYTGMDANSINISGENKWGWNVTMDGKTFSYTNSTTQEVITVENEVTFTVTALNDEYEFAYLTQGYDGNLWPDPADASWIHATKDGETVKVTADEAYDARTGYLFAFPKALYDEEIAPVLGDFSEKAPETFLDTYERFVMMELTQKAASTGFFIRNGATWGEIEATQANASDEVAQAVAGNLGVDFENIYQIEVDLGTSVIAYPQLSEEEWAGDAIAAEGPSFADMPDLTLEPGMDDTGMYVQFSVPTTLDSFMIVVFRGTDYMNKKALIIYAK